ncbi:SixA phosphatase family protein [Nocardioides zeae]|uniref:Histidine phosphatase family protein n=1 Tax=Nocardioides zeae TaxID=1457234 RepID=A0A6P0HEG5_9ACTN|nr:histidine phosphatase family protein [Nocardioides zeae]NEN77073.1 histidine phosphatase family protein [Nocardioides zeae]
MPPTRDLVLLRHGKSDWSTGSPDRERPVGRRGRRQAAEAGAWLAAHGPRLDLALVSPAVRATTTWDLAAAHLATPPALVLHERVYTFDAGHLAALVAGLDDDHHAVVVVGHDPGLTDLASTLAGRDVEMPTSALAWLRWEGRWDEVHVHARFGSATLRAAGRPPAQPEPPDLRA